MKLDFSASLFWLGEARNRIKASKFSDAQKAFIIKQGEAFNGRFRAECLNQRLYCRLDQRRKNRDLLTLVEACEKLEAWRRYYTEERPHGAIGNKVPVVLTKSWGVTSPSP